MQTLYVTPNKGESMKKLIFSVICLTLVFSLLSCNIQSDSTSDTSKENLNLCIDGNMSKTYDSVNILRSEKESISFNPDAKVIKLYQDNLHWYENVSAMAAKNHSKGNYKYMLVSENKDTIIKDSQGEILSSVDVNTDFFMYALNPEKVLDSTSELLNTYCLIPPVLLGEVSVICFSTQSGEIFLVHSRTYKNIYLFSASQFYDGLKISCDAYYAALEDASKNGELLIGSLPSVVSGYSKDKLEEFIFIPKK